MSQRRANERTSAEEVPQQPVADYWNNGPVPTWMGPLAYYNDGMEGQFRTGLSLAGDPGFSNQPRGPRSTVMEDTIFEMNQTGLSPMWRDPSPQYVDPRVGRPAMQARSPLPFQYVTEPPVVSTTSPASWETSAVDVHFRGRGPASSTARQTALYQSLLGQPGPGEAIGTATPVPVSQGYPVPQYPPYPPYPGPLTLPPAPLPGPTGYEAMQQDHPPAPLPGPTGYEAMQQDQPPPLQTASPAPVLIQLGASQNFLVNNRPARWIQVLDVDPSYQRARTPSPNRSPALSVYVRAPETEVHYWAVFLRDLTVQELIKRVVQKYGFSDDERDRVRIAVRVTEQGVRRLTDDDVRTLESEIAIDVKVTSLDLPSEEWQLELRY
ncbi:MAG: hypothetical protein ALECFALPRED_010847 [Alectoria fallacina]|uniref:GRHL1/CP2 C-terminal domain-containing protein n=1 Tax=Alectoria fallacina TaxID=1903189 RepID=A0A8H3J9R3_9LECA|nr:MAG: hypothetical protein ALECFALPRED_010847 [Alectoria fallacina]